MSKDDESDINDIREFLKSKSDVATMTHGEVTVFIHRANVAKEYKASGRRVHGRLRGNYSDENMAKAYARLEELNKGRMNEEDNKPTDEEVIASVETEEQEDNALSVSELDKAINEVKYMGVDMGASTSSYSPVVVGITSEDISKLLIRAQSCTKTTLVMIGKAFSVLIKTAYKPEYVEVSGELLNIINDIIIIDCSHTDGNVPAEQFALLNTRTENIEQVIAAKEKNGTADVEVTTIEALSELVKSADITEQADLEQINDTIKELNNSENVKKLITQLNDLMSRGGRTNEKFTSGDGAFRRVYEPRVIEQEDDEPLVTSGSAARWSEKELDLIENSNKPITPAEPFTKEKLEEAKAETQARLDKLMNERAKEVIANNGFYEDKVYNASESDEAKKEAEETHLKDDKGFIKFGDDLLINGGNLTLQAGTARGGDEDINLTAHDGETEVKLDILGNGAVRSLKTAMATVVKMADKLGDHPKVETNTDYKEIKEQRDYLREQNKSSEDLVNSIITNPFSVDEARELRDIIDLRQDNHDSLAENLMTTGAESELLELIQAFDRMSLKDLRTLKDKFGIDVSEISKSCEENIQSIRDTYRYTMLSKQLKAKRALVDGGGSFYKTTRSRTPGISKPKTNTNTNTWSSSNSGYWEPQTAEQFDTSKNGFVDSLNLKIKEAKEKVETLRESMSNSNDIQEVIDHKGKLLAEFVGNVEILEKTLKSVEKVT